MKVQIHYNKNLYNSAYTNVTNKYTKSLTKVWKLKDCQKIFLKVLIWLFLKVFLQTEFFLEKKHYLGNELLPISR